MELDVVPIDEYKNDVAETGFQKKEVRLGGIFKLLDFGLSFTIQQGREIIIIIPLPFPISSKSTTKPTAVGFN